MTAELSVFSAIVARMPDPTVQLAAWGVVFAVSTLVQAPSTSLLPAATALARDRASFAALARYGAAILAALTLAHGLVALTPLYDVLVRGVMGVPEEVAGAAWGAVTGLYVGVVGLTVAMLAQAAWLGYRASGLLRRAAAAAVGGAAP